MLGIRQKLALGFGGLVCTIAIVGVLTIGEIRDLGQSIDVILRENYRSVVACQDMKDALERIDSGVLLSFAGRGEQGRRFIDEYVPKFRRALEVEQGNITLPGELELATRIDRLFDEHDRALPRVLDASRALSDREVEYFAEIEPKFQKIKDLAQAVLTMNQESMQQANKSARQKSAAAYRAILMAVVASTLIAALFSYLVHRWILRPVRRLTETTNDIRSGNLEVVLERGSNDEIGQLAESFNEMTAALRDVRARDHINLMRTRQATQEVFKAVPTAIAVLDLEGRVDIATDAARRYFGFAPGALVTELGYAWLSPLVRDALDRDGLIRRESKGESVQMFIDNREHFFEPWAVPIPVGADSAERTGVCIILKDVTEVQEQQELKRDVVSTVSHQLKTPLTSLRMSLHLLLEDRLGPLNDKQTELLVAARDDSERLSGILEDLLDIDRIESGSAALVRAPASPRNLARDGIEPFIVEARDKGIEIENAVPGDLPEVMADATRIRHAFANLLDNALRFTHPGGSVTVRADREGDAVRFSIEDTGDGIGPEHLSRLYAPFYRVPGQTEGSGAGLGLAIVAEIVKAHGGTVDVASEPGRGSTFSFTLPVRDPATSPGSRDARPDA